MRRNRTKGRGQRHLWRIPGAAVVLFLAALLCGRLAAEPGGPDIEARVKDAFVYNFARFIEWPPRPGSSTVRIGILGHGDLGTSLGEIVRGKSANGKPIEVLRLNSAADAECCEILVVERSESKHLREIAQALAEKPVLTICDGGNCFRDGMMIAFQIVDESVRFQINQEAAGRAGLKISSQLLKVALPNGGNRL